MADWLGDPTPRMQGRLTLNPLKHLDPVGSIIVPILTSLAGFTFGWAKPVIYNPYNIKNRRQGEFLIALAGPSANLGIAVIFSLIIRAIIGGAASSGAAAVSAALSSPFMEIAGYIVVINIVLAVFNLIPLPPLDGSKLLLAFLPNQYGRMRLYLERFGPIFVLIVVFFLWQVISPVIPLVFHAFTGVSL